MPVRKRVLDDARHQAIRARYRIGSEIRMARLAAGLRQADVAARAGHDPSWLSRVERGIGPGVSVEDLVVVGAAVGIRVWIAAYPGGGRLHDAPQLQLLRRLRVLVGEAWTWAYEVPVPLAHDLRAADAVLRRYDLTVMVEAFTRLADAQAQLRSVALKARDMGVPRTVIVLSATHANRRAVAEAAEVVRTDYPISGRAMLRSLRAGEDPGGSGIVFA